MVRRDEFLRSQKILRLATAGPDRTPHIVPVWYLYSAKKFYIGTSTKTRKAKNVAGNGRVSICVDDGVDAPGIYGVMGQGNAVTITDASKVRRLAVKILSKYSIPLEGRSAKELLDATDCIIEVVPDRLVTWSY